MDFREVLKVGNFRLWVTPRLVAVTKPMGFPKGTIGSSSLWSTTGFNPRGRYNMIRQYFFDLLPELFKGKRLHHIIVASGFDALV